MNMNFFKEHPIGSAIGGVAIFVVLYLLMNKSGSKAATSNSPSSNTPNSTTAQNQYNAAVSIASLQAGVAQNKTAAQLAAAQQTANDATAVALSTNASKVAAVNSQFAYLTQVAQLQSKTAIAGSNNFAKVATTVSNNQASIYNTATKAKSKISQMAIRRVNDFNGSQNKAGLLESVTGNFAGAVANANSQTGANTASAIAPAAIVSSVSGAASSLLTGLFA